MERLQAWPIVPSSFDHPELADGACMSILRDRVSVSMSSHIPTEACNSEQHDWVGFLWKSSNLGLLLLRLCRVATYAQPLLPLPLAHEPRYLILHLSRSFHPQLPSFRRQHRSPSSSHQPKRE